MDATRSGMLSRGRRWHLSLSADRQDADRHGHRLGGKLVEVSLSVTRLNKSATTAQAVRFFFRHAYPPNPNAPMPNIQNIEGSGTGETTGEAVPSA